MYWVIETLLVQAGTSHPAPLRTTIGHIDSPSQKICLDAPMTVEPRPANAPNVRIV